MGLPGIEPGTSRLSGVRSNRLSYKPARRVLKKRDVFEDTSVLSLSKSTINYTFQKRICQINLLNSRTDAIRWYVRFLEETLSSHWILAFAKTPHLPREIGHNFRPLRPS